LNWNSVEGKDRSEKEKRNRVRNRGNLEEVGVQTLYQKFTINNEQNLEFEEKYPKWRV